MAAALPSINDCCSACSGVSVTVTTNTAPTNLYIYDTIADLRAGASPTLTNALAIVKGDAAAFDGGGGDYVWAPTSTTADDGVSVIKPNDKAPAEAGRWRKQI